MPCPATYQQEARAIVRTAAPIASAAALTAQPLAACPLRVASALQVGNDCSTFCAASPPSLSLRGGRRPTWRPEREARGSALGVQSRGGTCSPHRPPIKTHQPIASVAALIERHAGWQYLRYAFCGVKLSSLSFRGAKRRGNLAESGPITGEPAAKTELPSRDCTPRALPRASRSGRHGPVGASQ